MPTFVSVKNGVFCGIVRKTSPVFTRPRFEICWESIVVSGCGESKPLRLMREPVTMISSSAFCCAEAVCAPAVRRASRLQAPRAVRRNALPRASMQYVDMLFPRY